MSMGCRFIKWRRHPFFSIGYTLLGNLGYKFFCIIEVLFGFWDISVFFDDPIGTALVSGVLKEGEWFRMVVGYIRVSTIEQRVERQEEVMERLGAEKIFVEKVSAKTQKGRVQLQAMMQFVREGDVVVVESISRIARNTKDLLEITERLESMGVEFVSQKEKIDTKTPAGKFMLTVFGAISQLEREYILARQREGIEIARKKGIYKGRKPIEVDPKEFERVFLEWKRGDYTAVEAMKKLGLKSSTFYRRVKEYEKLKTS